MLLHVDFTPDGTNTEMRWKLYKDEIIHVLALTSASRCEPLLRDTDALLGRTFDIDWDCSDYPQSATDLTALRDYANGTTVSDQDMLVAAAAVENLPALRRYAGRVNNLIDYGQVFCSVWKAVVIGEKNESLKYLLSRLPPPPALDHSMDVLDAQQPGRATLLTTWKALLSACDHGRVATGKTLIDFFSSRGILWDLVGPAYPSDAITRCMRSGCVELLDHLLRHLSQVDKDEIYLHITVAYLNSACRYGRIEVVRYLLDRNLVLPTEMSLRGHGTDDDDNQHPLVNAVECSQVDVMRLLLQYGARISDIPQLLPRALKHGSPGFGFRTVEFLFQHDVVVDDSAIYALEGFATKIMSSRCPTEDSCKTLIFVLEKMRGLELERPNFTRGDWEKFAADIQRILDYGLELPKEPIDFAEAGKECVAWLRECAETGKEDREDVWTFDWGLEFDD